MRGRAKQRDGDGATVQSWLTAKSHTNLPRMKMSFGYQPVVQSKRIAFYRTYGRFARRKLRSNRKSCAPRQRERETQTERKKGRKKCGSRKADRTVKKRKNQRQRRVAGEKIESRRRRPKWKNKICANRRLRKVVQLKKMSLFAIFHLSSLRLCVE